MSEINKSHHNRRDFLKMGATVAGLGTAIGGMMGIDYSTVSQGRKRLREKLKKDKKLSSLMKKIEADLSF